MRKTQGTHRFFSPIQRGRRGALAHKPSVPMPAAIFKLIDCGELSLEDALAIDPSRYAAIARGDARDPFTSESIALRFGCG